MNFQVITQEQYEAILTKLNTLQVHLAGKQKNPVEVIYDNSDLLKLLNISRSTLQKLRDEGFIGYSQIQGKFYYRQSDVNQMLEKYYKPPFK
jgi:hypothetical protein